MGGRLRILFLFSIIGILAITQALRNISRIENTANWKQTVATVKSINIERIKIKSGDNFNPIIEYNYCLNGNLYFGDKISFESGIAYKDSFAALLATEELLRGKNKINVYYNPKNLQESTILKGAVKNEYPILFLGIFFLSVGIYLNRKFINEKMKTVSNKLNKNQSTQNTN